MKCVKFDLSHVEFSKNDIRLGIKVPEIITPELAYFLGFHIGDGYMKIERRKNKIDYRVDYNGHEVNERKFYEEFLKSLIKQLFNKEVNVRKGNKTVMISFRSKAIVLFLNKCCEIPFSPKIKIKVPDIIKNSNKITKQSFLRGLADTDFSLVFKNQGRKPVINFWTYSKTLHESVKELLKELGFYLYSTTLERERKKTKIIAYIVEINGKKKLNQWMKDIGFSNYNTLTRYEIWKETGSLPVGTDVNERIKILKDRGIEFPLSASGRN